MQTSSHDGVRLSIFERSLRGLVCVVPVAGFLGASGCATTRNPPEPIAVQSVRLTAANHYVDLRYRVTDPERAQQLLGPGVKPRLIDERTGIAMAVPSTAKLGSLRQTQAVQKLDHTYFVLFINGAALQPGSKVTAELGSMTFRHLTVQ